MHQLCKTSIEGCDIDIRTDLYKNIILSGGSTLYEGLPNRVLAEMKKLAPKEDMVEVTAPADRYYSVWAGASVLSSLTTFDS